MERRNFIRGAGALCVGGVVRLAGWQSEPPEEGPFVPEEPDYQGWFQNVSNYRGTVDSRGQRRERIDVGILGANGDYYFGSAAVAIHQERRSRGSGPGGAVRTTSSRRAARSPAVGWSTVPATPSSGRLSVRLQSARVTGYERRSVRRTRPAWGAELIPDHRAILRSSPSTVVSILLDTVSRSSTPSLSKFSAIYPLRRW